MKLGLGFFLRWFWGFFVIVEIVFEKWGGRGCGPRAERCVEIVVGE